MSSTKRPAPLPHGIRARQLADGRVAYEVRWTDAKRRRQRYSVYDLDEAIEYLADRRREMRRGASGDPTGGRITLRDWSRTWWAGREIRDSTAVVETCLIRTDLLPRLGEHRLVDITKSEIVTWMAWLRDEQELSPATIARLRRLLSACLQAAVEDGRLATNQVALTRAPRISTTERRFLLPDEVAAIEAATDPWWRLAIPLLADTGLRVGELAALRVGDIRIDIATGGQSRSVPVHLAAGARILGGSVTVARTTVDVGVAFTGATGRRQYHEPKSTAGRRVVPTITESVARRIVDHVLARSLSPEAPLFAGPRGAPMTVRNWRRRVWNQAVAQAGVDDPRPTPHAMRHTAVSYWIAAGTVEPLQLASWAGHRGTRLVYELYGHLLPKDPTSTRAGLEALRNSAQVVDRGTVVDLRTSTV